MVGTEIPLSGVNFFTSIIMTSRMLGVLVLIQPVKIKKFRQP